MADVLLYEVKDHIATVTMNRPQVKNATNIALLEALLEAVQKVEADEDVHVTILKGAGETFCAGADLAGVFQEIKEVTMYTIPEFLHRLYNPLVLGIFNSMKPWIAQVEGYAVGAGCNLAIACDFVVAAEDATFCEIFAQRGLSVDAGGSYLLVHLVGLRKAKELLFFSEKVAAPKAVEIGLINEAVPNEKLESRVLELAERLKKGPRKSLWQMKDNLHQALSLDFPTSLKLEEKAQGIASRSKDAEEGVMSFLQKRDPDFKGK